MSKDEDYVHESCTCAALAAVGASPPCSFCENSPDPLLKIRPDPDCPHCHGEGQQYDIVPFGGTTAEMPEFCICVENQIPEGNEDIIELDLTEVKTVFDLAGIKSSSRVLDQEWLAEWEKHEKKLSFSPCGSYQHGHYQGFLAGYEKYY